VRLNRPHITQAVDEIVTPFFKPVPDVFAVKRQFSYTARRVHSVEGVVDLGFRQETSDFNGWAVVDFRLGVHPRRKRGWLEGLKADLTLKALGC